MEIKRMRGMPAVRKTKQLSLEVTQMRVLPKALRVQMHVLEQWKRVLPLRYLEVIYTELYPRLCFLYVL